MSAHPWLEHRSLGAATTADGLLATWLGRLSSVPEGTMWVENGVDREGAFLRTLAPPAVTIAEEHCGTAPMRSFRREVGPSPLTPGPGERLLFGRLVWSENPRSPPPLKLAGFPLPQARWTVQGFFERLDTGALSAHLRIAAAGTPIEAEKVRDEIGVRWATAIGATFEPWAPGSHAERAAGSEWYSRSICRFHSGAGPVPPVERLAQGWIVPEFRLPARSNPPARWRLGWGWWGADEGMLTDRELLRHMGIVGMTGSGKTQYLAALAAEAVRNGVPVALFDLQGDLGPAALARMSEERRRSVIIVDGAREWGAGRVGVDVLGSQEERSEDLVSAELLAALRPLGATGEEFWGPRMERILDSCVRSIHESGGNLGDLASLLFDPLHQAEVCARSVQNERLRGFLEGLPALQRRVPDYLTSSQNRIAPLALSRLVEALVAPSGPSIDVGQALAEGRSFVFYLPKGSMGEAPALFVANLFLAHLYLAMSRSLGLGTEEVRVLALADEAQNFSQTLLRTLAENGRKFGLAVAFATQSIERLETAVGSSLLATLGTVVALRTPPPGAFRVVSLLTSGTTAPPERAALESTLASLPDHTAMVRSHASNQLGFWQLPSPVPPAPEVWRIQSERSAAEFGSIERMEGDGGLDTEIEQVLLETAQRDPPFTPSPPTEMRSRALHTAQRRGWIAPEGEGRPGLTPAGWVRLGARGITLAPRESTEHTRLMRDAFRIFARQGVRLEFPEQGRFDVRVPDGVAYLVSPEERTRSSPVELSDLLGQRRATWLWRLGHGRNIHVEAEVSSLRDRTRLSRSVSKARRAGAFLLFVTGTSTGGRTLRRYLAERGSGPEVAAVWVLRPEVSGNIDEAPHGLPPGERSARVVPGNTFKRGEGNSTRHGEITEVRGLSVQKSIASEFEE